MLINLTPHPIMIRAPGGAEIIVPPSGVVARSPRAAWIQMRPSTLIGLFVLAGLALLIARATWILACAGWML
jgi:hypothetical protein